MPDDMPAPEFIPDDIQTAHLDQARRQVASSRQAGGAAGTEQVASGRVASGRHVPPGSRVGVLTAAVVLGFLGLFGLALLWTWLALSSDAPTWTPFAVGGWIATVTLPGLLAGFWWERGGSLWKGIWEGTRGHTTPRFHPRGDANPVAPRHRGG